MIRKLALCSAVLLALLASPDAMAANAIRAENALPGDSYWTAATQEPVSANPPIEGYADATSVRPGGVIGFHVATTAVASYRIEISRLGWYGGAGGRRITCLVGSELDPTCTSDHVGAYQPVSPAPDPVTGEITAGWPATDTLAVPTGWTTGYYLAIFRLTSGPSSGETGFAPFIVQAPVGDRAAILAQVPTNTWQAYNSWGGESYYTKPQAVKVSFDRPYDHRLLFNWEYPLVRFLERGGWDVSYATDDDVTVHPSILLDHSLDISAGHDEYWTKAMRDGWEAARDAGVNLAIMGANDSFWQVRYEDGGRTMVGYKALPDPTPDPAQTTTEFRDLTPPRPECQLFGVQFQNVVLINRNIDATADPAVAQDPWFVGTGLAPDAVLSGLGGGETDAITPGCHVPPVTPLLTYSGAPLSNGLPARGDAVRYTACSGAEVFSGGSLQFAWGLDSWRDPSYTASDPWIPPVPPANAGLQQAMTQALADLTRSHVPVPGPPHICVPTAGITAPAAWATVGQPASFRSTASDPYGQISGQKWSIRLNGSSSTATGPAVTRIFRTAGIVHLTLAVSDASGATATAAKTLNVCRCPAPSQPSSESTPLTTEGLNTCQLMRIGTLRVISHRLWFTPDSWVKQFSITTYRITARGGRISLVRLASEPGLSASGPLAIPAARASIVVDVTSPTAAEPWHQQFLVPFDSRHLVAQPGLLTQTLCDGTSGHILRPAFGGSRSLPLRLAVAGQGRLTVSLITPDGRTIYRRSVIAGARARIVSLAAGRPPRGPYELTISSPHGRLQQHVRLTAIGL